MIIYNLISSIYPDNSNSSIIASNVYSVILCCYYVAIVISWLLYIYVKEHNKYTIVSKTSTKRTDLNLRIIYRQI